MLLSHNIDHSLTEMGPTSQHLIKLAVFLSNQRLCLMVRIDPYWFNAGLQPDQLPCTRVPQVLVLKAATHLATSENNYSRLDSYTELVRGVALQPGAPQDVGPPKLVGVVTSSWAQERSHVAVKGSQPGQADVAAPTRQDGKVAPDPLGAKGGGGWGGGLMSVGIIVV